MWIDARGNLFLPATQLNRTAAMNGGVNAVVLPVTLYRLHVGARPAPNDHL